MSSDFAYFVFNLFASETKYSYAFELEKSKLGVCHDFSLYAYYHLTRNGYNCKLMYLTNSSVTKTHSFVIITIHNKQYWFESAWGNYIGIHELKNGYKVQEM